MTSTPRVSLQAIALLLSLSSVQVSHSVSLDQLLSTPDEQLDELITRENNPDAIAIRAIKMMDASPVNAQRLINYGINKGAFKTPKFSWVYPGITVSAFSASFSRSLALAYPAKRPATSDKDACPKLQFVPESVSDMNKKMNILTPLLKKNPCTTITILTVIGGQDFSSSIPKTPGISADADLDVHMRRVFGQGNTGKLLILCNNQKHIVEFQDASERSRIGIDLSLGRCPGTGVQP